MTVLAADQLGTQALWHSQRRGLCATATIGEAAAARLLRHLLGLREQRARRAIAVHGEDWAIGRILSVLGVLGHVAVARVATVLLRAQGREGASSATERDGKRLAGALPSGRKLQPSEVGCDGDGAWQRAH